MICHCNETELRVNDNFIIYRKLLYLSELNVKSSKKSFLLELFLYTVGSRYMWGENVEKNKFTRQVQDKPFRLV